MSAANEHVLTGIRVLDFTRNLAGPSCTRLLVEMGAEIIKVESAPHGERTRRNPEGVDRSLFFVQQNRGKKSVCVNLRDPRGIALIERMVPQVDVVVENFRPGVMTDMGLGYGRLVELRPDTILCSISALGQTGPLARKPGYDYIAQAYAGVTSMNGEPGEAQQGTAAPLRPNRFRNLSWRTSRRRRCPTNSATLSTTATRRLRPKDSWDTWRRCSPRVEP